MSEATEAPSCLAAFEAYRTARLRFLDGIGCGSSNRDPLAEFSEHLVAELLGGALAASRVQADYDVISRNEGRIQVKYLANRSGGWVNEHHVQFHGEMDSYAIVIFEDLAPTLVLVFSRRGLGDVCRLLRKRHPDQDSTLQLTRRNVVALADRAAEFAAYGVRVLRLEGNDPTLAASAP